VKRSRENDGVLTRLRAGLFNSLLSRLGGIKLENASDFKLLDRGRRRYDHTRTSERQRFYRGLADWVGYRHASIPFDVAPRLKVREMVALEAFQSRDDGYRVLHQRAAPDRHGPRASYAGVRFLVGATPWISWFQGRAVSGFATTIITFLIVGSFIMISLGIIGEYIAKSTTRSGASLVPRRKRGGLRQRRDITR